MQGFATKLAAFTAIFIETGSKRGAMELKSYQIDCPAAAFCGFSRIFLDCVRLKPQIKKDSLSNAIPHISHFNESLLFDLADTFPCDTKDFADVL